VVERGSGCQDPASTSPFWLNRQRRLGSAERVLLLTLPAYSHIWRGLIVLAVPITPGIVSSRLFSHALRGLVVLAVSVMPGVVSSRLFSHALRGLIVLTVSVTPGVVSSQLFSHALRGLVVLAVSVTHGVVSAWLFSHNLRGLVVLAVSVMPGVVSSRLFSHALRGLVVLGRDDRSTGHGDREVGLWREIIDCVEKDLQTSYCALPLYLSFPLWNHSLPARLTQFLPSSS